ncbi:MAG: hypothetical protein PWP11_878 [Thauera sp.]|nr:hypothetical protein [Thauera sp.]MDI3489601.1 hypothetical protein [Thauera sp.]
MNPNTDPTQRNPLPRWAAWLAAVLIFAGYGALEALDAHTEVLIAQADAEAAKAVAKVAIQYGIECGQPVQVAEARP